MATNVDLLAVANPIQIAIHLTGADAFSARLVAETVSLIDRVATRVEGEELDAVAQFFTELPPVALDAARFRFDDRNDGVVYLHAVAPGSLIVTGSVIAVGLWVLEKTLGETLKEAWIDSESHARLREFLGKRLDKKAERIVSRLMERGFARRGIGFESVVLQKRGDVWVIIVTVLPPE